LDKKTLKQKCLKKFKKISFGKKIKINQKVIKKLEIIIRQRKAKNILIYLPLDFEVDLRPLIYKNRKKINFFVPFMQDISFKMVTFRLPFKKDKFNIKQSGKSYFRLFKIDLAIVPVVAIDNDFRRVGFGKGMYDRFFDALPYRPFIVFVQPTFCACNKKITFSYDIQGDVLLASNLLLNKKKGWKYGIGTFGR